MGLNTCWPGRPPHSNKYGGSPAAATPPLLEQPHPWTGSSAARGAAELPAQRPGPPTPNACNPGMGGTRRQNRSPPRAPRPRARRKCKDSGRPPRGPSRPKADTVTQARACGHGPRQIVRLRTLRDHVTHHRPRRRPAVWNVPHSAWTVDTCAPGSKTCAPCRPRPPPGLLRRDRGARSTDCSRPDDDT